MEGSTWGLLDVGRQVSDVSSAASRLEHMCTLLEPFSQRISRRLTLFDLNPHSTGAL